MGRYKQAIDGEWESLDWESNRIACCDCGLVHQMEFKVVKGKLYVRAFRNERSTASQRKNNKLLIKIN